MVNSRKIINGLIILMVIFQFTNILFIIIPDEHLFVSAGKIPLQINSDWNVINYQRYDGGICVLNGNLTIYNNGILILNNLVLELNNTYSLHFNISINAGGVLKIFNSTIKSINSSYKSIGIWSIGSIQMENSTFMNTLMGIQLIGGDIFVNNSKFLNNSNVFIIKNGNASIDNNNISDNLDGITIINGECIIDNNKIVNSETGIYIISGNAQIKNNIVMRNSYGIQVYGGNITFNNDIVSNNSEYGFFFSGVGKQSFIVENCRIEWNGNGVFALNTTPKFIASSIKYNHGEGIYLQSNGVMNIYNSTIINNNQDITFGCGDHNPVCEINLYNSTYNTTNITKTHFNGLNYGILKFFYFVDITAKWQSDGFPVISGWYTIGDRYGNIVSKNNFNNQGKAFWIPVMEYLKTPSLNIVTPHIIKIEGTRGSITRTNESQPVQIDRNKHVVISLDDVPPNLIITDPKEGFISNNRIIIVTGYTDPGNTILFNSTPIDVNNTGNFTTTFFLPNEGKNEIVLKAYDKAGNEKDAEINVTRDTIPPILTIDNPKDGALFNYTQITINGSTEKGASLKINDKIVSVSNDGKFATNMTFFEGNNFISVISKDKIGNSILRTLKIIIDITPPILFITSPQNEFLTRNATINVTGITEIGARIKINDKNILVYGNSFQTVFNLSEGINIITLEACDQAGNCVTRMANVTKDSISPSIDILEPIENETVLKVIMIHGKTEKNVIVIIDEQIVNVSWTGDFYLNVTLNLGKNQFKVKVFDKAGNVNYNLITITRLAMPKTNVENNYIPLFMLFIILFITVACCINEIHRKGKNPQTGKEIGNERSKNI